LGQPNRLQPQKQFAEKMGRLVESRTPPHGHQPFSMSGGVDQRVQPQQASKMQMIVRDLPQVLVGKQATPARRERHDAVIHLLLQEAVEVDEIAWNVNGRDLALSVAEQLVAGGKALKQKDALARAVSLPHHILVGLERFDPCERALKSLLLLI
jgi:hypothetical protein